MNSPLRLTLLAMNIQRERDFYNREFLSSRKICTEKGWIGQRNNTRQFESRIPPSSCKWTSAWSQIGNRPGNLYNCVKCVLRAESNAHLVTYRVSKRCITIDTKRYWRKITHHSDFKKVHRKHWWKNFSTPSRTFEREARL